MNGIVPSSPLTTSPLGSLGGSGGGAFKDKAAGFLRQPAVAKALPWFAGLASLGVIALMWAALAPAPQRVLYGSLGDAERAGVVAALDQASIPYNIDNNSGALTVGEDDLYRARMVVASDGALATPETGDQLIESLPMGASRTLEGDRLRAAQERDLTLTIQEIDGVEAVRVHLARSERSVFVRENVAPSASVMVRMARGRQLAASQVTAIANLVAGSVPGLSIDAVRIVDQNGRLLSDTGGENTDGLELQARMEAKLRAQIDQLLAPMVGAENFSSEIQVELDMSEVTSARESYDKEGAVRRETTQTATTAGMGAAMGVPGATTNTPPPDPQAIEGAPQDTQVQPGAGGTMGESSATRAYELGREVAVSNVSPGGVKRVSVAVALNQDALKGAKPADLKKFEQLVSAAVGANVERGDTVAVVVRPFKAPEAEEIPFWETPWFAMIVRNAVALICVLLVLFLVARPIVRALTKPKATGEDEVVLADGTLALPASDAASAQAGPDREQLSAQIELAQRIAREQPDDALQALRRMLGDARQNEGTA